MQLIYKDKYVVVCHKCAGEISEGEGDKCLPTIIASALSQDGEKSTQVFPVHRLDRETSGLIVYARTPQAAASLSASIQSASFKKEYLTVVSGTPQKSEDTLCDLLFYDRQRGKSFVVQRERGGVKKASLDYSLISSHDGISLLRVRLHTGRTHQIRAQLSYRGLPVVGDRRYGSPIKSPDGIALLSYKLSFPHPKDGKALDFCSEIPASSPWDQFSF